jgi:protein-disulfide isomerase
MAKSTVRKKASTTSDQAALLAGIAVVTIAFVAVLVFFINQAKGVSNISVSPDKYAGIAQTTTSTGAPMLGSTDAKVTIMEFADFSCSHCLEYEPTMQQFIEQYVKTGKAKLVYQSEIFVGGQYSQVAALAALCAGKQGHFWEMRDALFNMQHTLGYTAFEPVRLQQVADQLGIDGTQVSKCITDNQGQNSELNKVLESAYNTGNTLGVNGTPAVVYSVDGQTFTWVPDSNGNPITVGGPALSDLARVVDKAYS